MELAKTFGGRLFGALFETDVRALYRSSAVEATNAGHGLRLTLALTSVPELLRVPWEYLYDRPMFPSTDRRTPIVRYLELPRPIKPFQIRLPLRILAIVSAPSDLETIDAAQERSKLEEALEPLRKNGAVAIDWLEDAESRRPLPPPQREGPGAVPHPAFHRSRWLRQRGQGGGPAVRGRGRQKQGRDRRQARGDPPRRRLPSTGRAQFMRGRASIAERPILERRHQPDRARYPGGHRDAVRDHRSSGDPLLRRVLRGTRRRPGGRRIGQPGAHGDLRRQQRHRVGHARPVHAGQRWPTFRGHASRRCERAAREAREGGRATGGHATCRSSYR